MSQLSSTDQAKDKPKSEEAFWDTLLDEAEQPEQPVAARVTQDASEVNPAATADALNPPESPPPITSSSISPPQSPPPITASSTSPSLMQPKKQKLDYDHVTRDLLKYVVNASETAMLEEKYNDKLKSAAINVLIMLSIMTAFFGLTEEWSFGDSLWFSFVTMTTIGYGDFTPTTPFGRGWFVVLSIVGLGQMTLFLAEIVDYTSRQREILHSAMKRIKDARRKNGHKPVPHDRLCCGILPGPKTDLQKSFIDVISCMISFWFLMGAMAYFLKWSEGWELIDGVYFAFQTSSTIGYGDQSSLYRYREHGLSQQIGVETPHILWSEVTLGTNSSLNQVPFDSCLQSKGTCTVDGESCSCSFSGIGKLILALYFLASGASLGALFDSVLTYSALLEHEAEEVLRKRSESVRKSMTRRITSSSDKLIDIEEGKKGTIDQKNNNKDNNKNSKVGVKIVPANGNIADADDGGSNEDDKKKKKTSCFHFGRSFAVLGVVVGYLFLGGFIFYSLEPDNFPTLIESTYFCTISLTTIGYGDYSVSTDAGKIVLIFYCIIGVGLMTQILQAMEHSMQAMTNARVSCIKRMACFKSALEDSSDESVIVGIVIFQSAIVYTVGLTLFLIFECVIGQNGNFHIESNAENPSWTDIDVLLFFNAVTTTTIGYGANFYPRTEDGRRYLMFFAWLSLSNTFMLLDAINDFVLERTRARWKARQRDTLLTSGLSELEGLLRDAETTHPEFFLELDEKLHADLQVAIDMNYSGGDTRGDYDDL